MFYGVLCFFWFVGITTLCNAIEVLETPVVSKASPSLNELLKKTNVIDILVSMKQGTNGILNSLNLENSDLSRSEKGTLVYNALFVHAKDSQQDVMEFLEKQGHLVKSFWITNQIFVKHADISLIENLSTFEEVSTIDAEEIIYIDDVVLNIQDDSGLQMDPRAEWGIDIIQASEAWSLPGGNNGTGAKVGTIDTGVRLTHQALANNYVGNTNNGWFDAYEKTPSPRDDNGHGTHVTGTIVGQYGIGVAPGARWMACKALKADNSGTSAAFISCGQFFTCPTDTNGNNPDCSKAPHIVSNSWYAFGAGGQTWFDAVINAWTAAGIIPVFCNGNSGPNCGSAVSPADNRNVIAVGATTNTEGLASFSSVGPSAYREIKPDISAPGQNIRSSYYTSDTAYTTMSGTSMATPHTAGVLALMHSYDPNISFALAKSILTSSADRKLTSGGVTCGGINDSTFPNNHFGYGRLNALKAMQLLLGN